MAANTSPIFVLKPKIGMARISTANTNRDGTGTLGDLLTGATDGSRIHKIVATATGTTTAGMLRFFLYDTTNYRLWFEMQVAAITPSASVKVWSETVELPGEKALFLPSTWLIKVSTHNAETFDVIAFAGEYS